MNREKTKFLGGLTEKIEENLPTVLTGAGIIAGLASVGFAVYAGWKIREITEDESKTTKQKAKDIAKVSAPVVVGAAVATTCAVAANRESAARIVAASSLVAVSKIDKKETKKKIEEVTGIKMNDDTEEKKEESIVVQPHFGNANVRMKDGMTGFRFDSTMNNFWKAVAAFNDEIGIDEGANMLRFYEILLGKGDGIEYLPTYETIKFGGYEEGPTTLQPRFIGCDIDGDMQPVYVFVYNYGDVKYQE